LKTEERNIQIESTMTGEKIGLSINAEDMPHILSILTDLYEDRVMAIIREYSTNARDAHIDAGKADVPIEVTLPTPLNPFLSVKDFGLGLSADEVRTVYSKYGASTKRESNSVQGMLGLGCKSALTYSDQFTVSAVKDGVKVEISVSRDEDGGGHMELVDEFETDEPNGVEIIIQANQGSHYEFETKAANFFKYWEEGTVLVNGEQPTRVDGFWIADDLLILEEQGNDAIVMGNVAYPLPDSYRDWNRKYSIVAFMPIGSVAFAPSRESLSMNTKTTEAVNAVIARVPEEAGKAISKQIADAPTRHEAVSRYFKLSSIFNNQDFKIEATYKGKEIPVDMEAPADQQFVVVTATAKKGYRSKGWNRARAFPSSVWNKTIFIRGYDGADFSPYKRMKMDQWLNEREVDGTEVPYHETVVFTKVVPNHHWIDKNRIFNWSDIKDQKIVRENVVKRDGRVSGSYEGYVDGGYQQEILADTIDTDSPVLFCDKSYGYDSNAMAQIQKEYDHSTLVLLGANRVNKFQRDFPNAMSLSDFVKKMAQDWAASLTDDEKLHLAINDLDYTQRECLENLRGLELDDPALTFAIDQIQNRQTKLKMKHDSFKSYVSLTGVEWKNPLHQYPLLQSTRLYGTMGTKMKEHVTIYLNAAYAASQEEA
jgi:hypothetical protein